jgi:hypothetical protein
MSIQFKILIFYSRSEEQLQERLRLKKSVTSLSAVIRALGSPLVPNLKSDIVTDLYSGSTPIANMNESDCQISFNSINKFIISLSTVIGASCSYLGSHPESDVETDLYSGSTLIAIKTSLIVGSALTTSLNLRSRSQRQLRHWALLYDLIQKVI